MISYLEGTQIGTGDTALINIHFDKLKKVLLRRK